MNMPISAGVQQQRLLVFRERGISAVFAFEMFHSLPSKSG